MAADTDTEYLWPTPEQELLLRAALLSGEAAVGAWRRWQEGGDLDTLDWGSQRLLPLVYKNLHAHGVQDPLMGRLRGYHRRAWAENQLMHHAFARALARLREGGVPVMLLKGAALLVSHYEDFGLRPMSDVDILVPEARAPEACRLLQDAGWAPRSAAAFGPAHSVLLEDREGRQLDLHWRVLAATLGHLRASVEAEVWAASVEATFLGVPVRVPCAEDQFFHVCVHGVRRNQMPPLRWVADAMTVLRGSPDLDWGRVVATARRAERVLALATALRYLRDTFGAVVPDGAIAALERRRPSVRELVESGVANGTAGSMGRLVRCEVARHSLWDAYLRHAAAAGAGPTRRGFLRFLRAHWRLGSGWHLPLAVARRVIDRGLTAEAPRKKSS